MNWNRPGDISGALPISVQLFKGNAGLVEASTLKRAPGVLVNENWKEPFVSITKFAMVGAARAGVVTLIMRLRLGMPLTNMVAKAQPGGRSLTGAEVKKIAE
jgi:hypothetical protein